MKLNISLLAALLGLALAGCEQPAEQDEPDQAEPDTKATMQREEESQPGQIETGTERTEVPPAEEMGTEPAEETGSEDEPETDEPPPQQA